LTTPEADGAARPGRADSAPENSRASRAKRRGAAGCPGFFPLAFLCLLFLCRPALASGENAPQLTGYTAVPANPASAEAARLLAFWERIRKQHSPQAAFDPARSPMPAPVREQWKNLALRMPGLPRNERLLYINGFFNRWTPSADQAAYGQREYWATPEEFLRQGGGDCEDYAIIKYLALLHFSEPAQDMWILLGKDRKRNAAHAVLAARSGSRVFILDNLSSPAYLLIPEPQYLQNFVPFYAINENGLWILKPE
jgi:predicted transglutaminase-like cysteine proteinase